MDGKVFACRTCQQCIKARKNDWVVRLCAEKITTGHALVFALSYRDIIDEDGNKVPPPGAIAFYYEHVRLFNANVRKAYKSYYGETGVRFFVCGERGSKNDRVHWHIVLFSKRPLGVLGEWADLWFKPLPEMKLEDQVHWQYWPHGLVYVQEPDQGGMEYVAQYTTMEAYNGDKSKGTGRFTKSNNSGASYLRMSKSPPLGEAYLEQLIAEYDRIGAVPPNLRVTVPEYSGYWYPKGKQRELYLQGLNWVNGRIRDRTGRNAPQWASLIASVGSDYKTDRYIRDMEALEDGWKTQEQRREENEHDAYQSGRRFEQDRAAKLAAWKLKRDKYREEKQRELEREREENKSVFTFQTKGFRSNGAGVSNARLWPRFKADGNEQERRSDDE